MSLMTEADREKLRRHFDQELASAVTVELTKHGVECPECRQADELLGEISELSDRVELVARIGDGALPRVRLEGNARGEVSFVGLPAGYEFPTLIESIVDVSRGTTSLAPDSLERLEGLDRRVHVHVFTTPT